ncbi:MAG: SMC-Scp complex subunit ScpB [bacterium]|nr:SMC-Scp complex subunit ScpB [bacterium]
MELDAAVEALLFYSVDEMSLSQLAETLKREEGDILDALENLRKRLTSGIVLIEANNQYKLATAPGASEIIANVRQEELSRDLGKAGTETLAIIAYRGPISKATIDFIRGVNCASILRNLLIRGLVLKIQNPNDPRGVLYQVSVELLAHLGLTTIKDLPEYVGTNKELDSFFTEQS